MVKYNQRNLCSFSIFDSIQVKIKQLRAESAGILTAMLLGNVLQETEEMLQLRAKEKKRKEKSGNATATTIITANKTAQPV